MQRKEYHRKYLMDIRLQSDIESKDVFSQVKKDYEVNSRDDVEYAQKRLSEIGKIISDLRKNRKYNANDRSRILVEYSLRARIASYFPRAFQKRNQEWQKEQEEEMVKTPEYKQFELFAESVKTGKPAPTKKERSEFSDIFEGLVDRIGGGDSE